MVPSLTNTALPKVNSVTQCAEYELTVAPFLHQLFELSARLLQNAASLEGVKQVYTTTNPVITAFAFSLVIAQLTFIVSTINKNYSQIDRLWSILPAVYNGHYWLWASLHDVRTKRLDAIAIFTGCWAMRLTYNYARKGGYNKGSEDYRWELIKKYVNNEPVWVVFNYIIISTFQSILLALVTAPTYIIMLISFIKPDMGRETAFWSQVLGVLLLIEFYADNQQWAYQQAKKEYRATAKVPDGFTQKDLDRGFITTGLWGYSRHPNFAAEQTIWVVLYQWACFESGTMINWTFVGPMLYLAVFQASTPITEYVSAGKYAEYKLYQERIGKFLPSFGRPTWTKWEEQEEKKKAEKGEKVVKTPASSKGKGSKKTK